jgi:hypothetical protein
MHHSVIGSCFWCPETDNMECGFSCHPSVLHSNYRVPQDVSCLDKEFSSKINVPRAPDRIGWTANPILVGPSINTCNKPDIVLFTKCSLSKQTLGCCLQNSPSMKATPKSGQLDSRFWDILYKSR